MLYVSRCYIGARKALDRTKYYMNTLPVCGVTKTAKPRFILFYFILFYCVKLSTVKNSVITSLISK